MTRIYAGMGELLFILVPPVIAAYGYGNAGKRSSGG
jgi:hypothetical protein